MRYACICSFEITKEGNQTSTTTKKVLAEGVNEVQRHAPSKMTNFNASAKGFGSCFICLCIVVCMCECFTFFDIGNAVVNAVTPLLVWSVGKWMHWRCGAVRCGSVRDACNAHRSMIITKQFMRYSVRFRVRVCQSVCAFVLYRFNLYDGWAYISISNRSVLLSMHGWTRKKQKKKTNEGGKNIKRV